MRRMPSQIAALHRLLDEEIRVELIAEPLHAVDATAQPAEVASHLDKLGFDECGVRRDGRVVSSVRRSDLGGDDVGQRARPVSLERIVAAATPLWTCMDRIAEVGPLFVLGVEGLDGIVTRADLHKQPSRLLMFGVVSMLEMVVLELVRDRIDGERLKAALSPRRIEKAETLYQERKRIGEEIDLADCLQLCDKRDICLTMPDVVTLWEIDAKEVEAVFESLQRIRDNLAHAQSPAPAGNWAIVIEALHRADDILRRTLRSLSTQLESIT